MLIKIIGATAATLVIAVSIVAVGMWRGFIPVPGPLLALLVGAKGPEYSARYYPPDTLAYAWVTLAPGGGQLEDMRDIWERFNEYPGFEDLVEELKADFLDETDIDLETEVMPWIGPEMAVAVIEIDGIGSAEPALDDGIEAWDAVTMAATIGVRDKDVAAGFLSKWLDYMSRETDADFVAGSQRGFDTWVDEDAHQAYALSDNWLAYATDETTLKEMLDRIEDGGDGDSLAEHANFTAARAALPKRRFSSFYVDYLQALELFDDLAGGLVPLMPGAFDPTAFAQQAPDWVAGSTGWVERGITTEVVSPAVADFGLETIELEDPASLLPADTLGFMAGAFDPDVDHWRTALAEYPLTEVLPYPELLDEINAGLAEMAPGGGPALADDATLADALDLGFDLAKDFTGIDLETDFFDHLSGQAILAVSDFDFDAVANDPAANAIDAVMMLSYRENGKDGLADTMDEVAGLLEEDAGLTANSVDVGADDDATVFGLGFLGMMAGGKIGYQPGYVLHDEYLTIGTTEDALATIVARQNGDGDSLSSDDEYRRATSHLDNGRQFLAYVDVQSIIGNLEADDLDLERGQYRILDEGLGVAAFSTDAGEHYSRGVAVLTLFPE